jgi:hypothetical protein
MIVFLLMVDTTNPLNLLPVISADRYTSPVVRIIEPISQSKTNQKEEENFERVYFFFFVCFFFICLSALLLLLDFVFVKLALSSLAWAISLSIISAVAGAISYAIYKETKDQKVILQQTRTEIDSPRCDRIQSCEYDKDSRHVQWAPRVQACAGKVLVQQCSWTPLTVEETNAYDKHHLSEQQGQSYLIKVVENFAYEPEDLEIVEQRQKLIGEAIILERASERAYFEASTQKQAEKEYSKERAQLASQVASQLV